VTERRQRNEHETADDDRVSAGAARAAANTGARRGSPVIIFAAVHPSTPRAQIAEALDHRTTAEPQTTMGIEIAMPNTEREIALRGAADREHVVHAHYPVGDDDRLDRSAD
jgi:hypothetical protein